MNDNTRRLVVLTLVIALSAAILAWIGRRDGRYGLWNFFAGRPAPVFAPEQYTVPTEPALAVDEVPSLARLNEEYTRLAAAVIPSVVSIDTSETVNVRSGFPGYYRSYQRPGLGSGVIVTPEGHVITNHHVVANKDAIRVTLTPSGGEPETFAATLVGSLPSYDIAVLRIASDGRNFPALKIGDSTKVRVGQLAIAIGNPYGLAGSVTQGIISAVDRRIADSGPSYFQTDTPINPGNSGGPLVNFQGEVIGINSVVLRGPEADRAAQNIGFAIPAAQAWEAFEIITGRGRQVFGYLGFAVEDVTPQVASALGMADVQGAWIRALQPNGPAALAGLRAPEVVRSLSGAAAVRAPDVLLSLNGEKVRSAEWLVSRIRGVTPGSSVVLGVWRDGEGKEITATVGDSTRMPAPTPNTPSEGSTPPALDTVAKGRVVLHSVGITTRVGGADSPLIIESVRPGSFAEGKVSPGEWISAVNGAAVDSPASFHREVLAAVASTKGLKLKVGWAKGERDVLILP
ncbi:MAG: trypsin-like peptidase domain-containing protein [Verrucomicrobiales bacterium]